jgi:hypothetical protein
MSISTVQEKLFDTFLSVDTFNNENIEEAKLIFKEYQEKGIIIDSDFEDTNWFSSDQYSNITISFRFDPFMYKRNYEEVLDMSYEDFLDYFKTFIVFTFGKNSLKTIQEVTNDVKKIITVAPEKINASNTTANIRNSYMCMDFFTILAVREENPRFENFIDSFDQMIAANYIKRSKSQRTLCHFDTYFLFNDLMADYWKSHLTDSERLFFYPLYLWWNITAIIPLRTKEFILTGRNCLQKESDGYYLTLRRSKLKGSNRHITYKIESDYSSSTYKIPKRLAEEIYRYLALTDKFESTEIDSLFVTDTHYQHWGKRKYCNSRYLTHANLSTVLRVFYHDVIKQKYGISIVYEVEGNHLKKNEINFIHLGDTRHLALINIMAEGGTPVAAMLLSGHESIEMSSHYYSNITNLIECQTYRKYRLVTKGEVSYQLSKTELNLKETKDKFVELKNAGKCYSSNYLQGDFSDCLNSSGQNGEIGYCPNCIYFSSAGKPYHSKIDGYKKNIKDDCKNLERVINMVRLEKGTSEQIGEALLKLNTSSYSYQRFHEEKVAKKYKKGEDIWLERK